MNKKTMEETAVELAATAQAKGFKLNHLGPNMNQHDKARPWAAVIWVEWTNNTLFTGLGTSPVNAIIHALCHEKIFRQGWG
jgi:hypothetical protein